MNIHEYQAKNIFKQFGIRVPSGKIAYTPNEAKVSAMEVSEKGPWVVKAQIQAGSRHIGKFSDKRAGKKGGIRLSKSLDEVYENADEMLENLLITNHTGAKGRLVSRVYIEEYVKTVRKIYFGLVVDWVSAAVMLLITPITENNEDDIVKLATTCPESILKINLSLQKTVTTAQINEVASFLKLSEHTEELKNFINKMLKVFYNYDATMLEINPVGIGKDGRIWALDAKMTFDTNALYRHPDILKLADDAEIDERELTASKFGFQYKELESGIGIIVNGDGLALNIISEAKKLGMSTACFLNLKGGVDRDKIAASIKLMMTNPKVDGIFINILGGFLRCNLIADGIISVANDLGLNIPLVARFEGTNKKEATDILQKSGLSLLIADDTYMGLTMLKEAVEEDL
ncbi:MAG: succinate--CoA ligase subunit beta [Acetobacter sp.]|nr:succinate--CoA ligase subunit beta [Acetobacter sp.]